MPTALKRGLLALLLLFTAMLSLAYYYFQSENSAKRSVVTSGQGSLLNSLLENEKGKVVALSSQIESGKAVFLSFWATWCEPCLEEIPRIQQSQIPLRSQLIWVSLDYGSTLDRIREVKEWKSKTKIELSTLFDHKGTLTETLKIDGLPLNVLISPDGKILWSKMGLLKDADINEVEIKLQGL